MVKTDAFASLDATEQAKLVRTRKVKPIELVDAAIERIERTLCWCSLPSQGHRCILCRGSNDQWISLPAQLCAGPR